MNWTVITTVLIICVTIIILLVISLKHDEECIKKEETIKSLCTHVKTFRSRSYNMCDNDSKQKELNLFVDDLVYILSDYRKFFLF